MKKRGFLCICLTLIMLVGLLPDTAPVFMTAQASSERFVITEAPWSYSLSNQPISYEWCERYGRMGGYITVPVGTILRLEVARGSEAWLLVSAIGADGSWDPFADPLVFTHIAGGSDEFTFDTVGNFFVAGQVSSAGWIITVVANDQPQPQDPTPLPGDIPSPWATEHVTRAIELSLVPQNLQSNYTQATTRAEFTALAVALYETVTGTEITGRMEFNDTDDVNVQKMAYLGVVQGVGRGNFAPNAGLTREQAAVMLVRLADAIGQPFPPSAPTFADNAQMSSWAIEAIGQMQASGIMGGVGSNRFDPQGAYTREQSIITVLRLFNILD